MVHPIHSMCGSRQGFSGSADRMALIQVRQYPRRWMTAILEQPPSWNDGTVARNPCVSWAFLFTLATTLATNKICCQQWFRSCISVKSLYWPIMIMAHQALKLLQQKETTIVRCHKNSWIYLTSSTYYWWLLRSTITMDSIWFEIKKHYSHSTSANATLSSSPVVPSRRLTVLCQLPSDATIETTNDYRFWYTTVLTSSVLLPSME